MDFGALVCVPRGPRCGECPLRKICKAFSSGNPEAFPVKAQKTKMRTRYFHYIDVRQGAYTWLHKRAAGDVWQNLYEPPLIETCGPDLPHDHPQLKAWFAHAVPSRITARPVKHVLSHRIIYADLWQVVLPPAARRMPEGFLRVRRKELPRYAVSRLVQKLWAELEAS